MAQDALVPATFTHPLFGDIRVITLEEETWFVAVDVARILGHTTAKDLVRNLKKEYRGRQILPTPSGDQEMSVINPPGLFQAVMSSRKPQAEPFQKWVLGDVLPTIARRGSYTDVRNRMAETLSEATGGAIDLEGSVEPTVEVSLALLEALREELVTSRIERRLLVRTFSRTVGQVVRIVGAQRAALSGLDPDRPFSDAETHQAQMLFASGLTGKQVAKRMNRSYAAVARFMADNPEILRSAVQRSLI